MKNEIEEDKVIELLNEYKSIDFGCDMSDLEARIEEAINVYKSMVFERDVFRELSKLYKEKD